MMVKRWLTSLLPLFIYLVVAYVVLLAVTVGSEFFTYPIVASPVLAYTIAIGISLGAVWLATGNARLFFVRRFGRISDAVRQVGPDEGVDQYHNAVQTLRNRIPPHPARDLLISAHHRLWNLTAFAKWSQYDGVPEAMTSRFVEQAAAAWDGLWRSADRVAVLLRDEPEASGRLDDEIRKLREFLDGIKQARVAEAELTLLALRGELGEDSQNKITEIGLVALTKATEQLNAERQAD